MNPIYNFDEHTPPLLTEHMLKDKLERRTLRRQTKLLRLASLLSCACMLLLALLLLPNYPVISVILTIFTVFSLAAGGIVSIVFYKTGFIPE